MITRKTDEGLALTIPANMLTSREDLVINITICDIAGGRVRVGIEAPRSIGVWRTDGESKVPTISVSP